MLSSRRKHGIVNVSCQAEQSGIRSHTIFAVHNLKMQCDGQKRTSKYYLEANNKQ
jgi:hypothetical protein